MKQELFKDAHNIQQRIYQTEHQEFNLFQMEREKRISALMDKKIGCHRNEFNSLKQRILNGLDELQIQRKKEYEQLFLRFNNLKKTIENQHITQSIQMEKSIITQQPLFMSKRENPRERTQRLSSATKVEMTRSNHKLYRPL